MHSLTIIYFTHTYIIKREYIVVSIFINGFVVNIIFIKNNLFF